MQCSSVSARLHVSSIRSRRPKSRRPRIQRVPIQRGRIRRGRSPLRRAHSGGAQRARASLMRHARPSVSADLLLFSSDVEFRRLMALVHANSQQCVMAIDLSSFPLAAWCRPPISVRRPRGTRAPPSRQETGRNPSMGRAFPRRRTEPGSTNCWRRRRLTSRWSHSAPYMPLVPARTGCRSFHEKSCRGKNAPSSCLGSGSLSCQMMRCQFTFPPFAGAEAFFGDDFAFISCSWDACACSWSSPVGCYSSLIVAANAAQTLGSLNCPEIIARIASLEAAGTDAFSRKSDE